MRGIQIGAALGARVSSQPTETDWRWADVAILVKKHAEAWAPQAHRFGVPIIWDVLDCWAQPTDNKWTIDNGKRYVAAVAKRIKPVAMIAATQRMAEDIGGVYIPHHCRIGLQPTPPRERVSIVAYDGSERYLGAWEPAIRNECARRGWSFVINPPDLSRADILVAFRDGPWDGPICRAWKSGVKHVNAICAGRPIVGQPCAANSELNPIGATLESQANLSQAFDGCLRFRDLAARFGSFEHDRAWFGVEAIVDRYYRPLLDRVVSEAACTA